MLTRAPSRTTLLGSAAALAIAFFTGCAEGSGNYADRLGDQGGEPSGSAATGKTPDEEPPETDFAPATPNEWVTRDGTRLFKGGDEFRFAGSNNYYLMYSSRFMVDDVLETAANAGFNTLQAGLARCSSARTR
jgi:hypothetical protein